MAKKKVSKSKPKKENGFKCLKAPMTIYGIEFGDDAVDVPPEIAKRLAINSDFVQLVDGVEIVSG